MQVLGSRAQHRASFCPFHALALSFPLRCPMYSTSVQARVWPAIPKGASRPDVQRLWRGLVLSVTVAHNNLLLAPGTIWLQALSPSGGPSGCLAMGTPYRREGRIPCIMHAVAFERRGKGRLYSYVCYTFKQNNPFVMVSGLNNGYSFSLGEKRYYSI